MKSTYFFFKKLLIDSYQIHGFEKIPKKVLLPPDLLVDIKIVLIV
jgi:hypothetical protein